MRTIKKPDLQPERKYDSQAVIQKDRARRPEPEPVERIRKPPKSAEEKLGDLKELCRLLPSEVADIIEGSVDLLSDACDKFREKRPERLRPEDRVVTMPDGTKHTVSPDESSIVTLPDDRQAILIPEQETRRPLEEGDTVTTPDGTQVAVGEDGRVKLPDGTRATPIPEDRESQLEDGTAITPASQDSDIDIDDFDDDIELEFPVEEHVDELEQLDSRWSRDALQNIDQFAGQVLHCITEYNRKVAYILSEVDDQRLFEEYREKTAEISGDYKPASDLLHRLKIVKDQKRRMLGKIHNEEETSFQINKLSAVHEQRKRCHQARHIQEETLLEHDMNRKLRRDREQFDNRCDRAAADFYKYLNSTVILVDEYLDTVLEELKTKAVLIKAGEISD